MAVLCPLCTKCPVMAKQQPELQHSRLRWERERAEEGSCPLANPPLLEHSTKPHSVLACAHLSSLPTAALGNVVSLLELGALLLTESQNFANTQGGENGH